MLHPFPSWQDYLPSDPVPEHGARYAEAYMSEVPVFRSYSLPHYRIRNGCSHRHGLYGYVHDHDRHHEYVHEYESHHLHEYARGYVRVLLDKIPVFIFD